MRNIQRAVQSVLRLASCAALVGGVSPAAVAQQAEPTAGTVPFEEIVVTAQRREQNIQDVGISVTPLGEETLQNLNINTATIPPRTSCARCRA